MIKDDNLKKLLISRKILSPDQLNAAVVKQRAEFEAGQTQRLLGDILVAEGLLSPDKLKELADNAPTLMLEERASQDLPEDVAKAAANPANDLGKYIKMGALGRGGMGVVVKAWDRNLRRYVALKFLETTSPDDLKRFQREAQLSASLRHPNIVQVHEMGSLRGRAYIAMDCVQGHSLEKYGGKIPPKKLCEIMSPICDALSTAHAREIIHRDVKPHNIMIDIPPAGQSQSRKLHPYIMDFGLAKVVNMDSSLSVSGVIMGTPHYMSPEQASGQVNAVDRRSDLYSLGATMYWLLTGKAPLDGETPLQIVLRLQTDEPPPLRKIKPDVPVDVDTIIMKCLAKDKSQRYQTADELKLDLDLFLSDQPIKAHAPSLSYLIKHKLRKHKAWVIAGTAFALVLLVVTGFFVTRLQNLRASRPPVADASKRERSFELFNQARGKVDKARTELSADARAARRERLTAAIRELDEAVKLNPNEAGFYFYRAEAKYLLWLGRTSIPDYEKALALDPKLGDALYRKIMVTVLQFQDGYDITLTLAQGRPRFILSPFSKTFDAAALRSDLERLRSLGEHKAKVHCIEGVLLFYEGKFEEAENAFDEASKLESFAEPIALRGYVGLVMDSGPLPSAIAEELDRAITLDPNMPLYYVLRAVAYLGVSPDWKRDRTKEAQPEPLDLAEKDIDEALQLTPDASDLYVVKAYIQYLRQDLDLAAATAAQAKRLDEGNPRADMVLAMIAWSKEDRAGALAILEAALQRSPEYAPLYYLQGMLLVATKDIAKAEKAFERYLSLIPQAQQKSMREYLERAKAFAKLVDDLGRAGNPQLILDSARALFKEGRDDEAKEEYTRLLANLAMFRKTRQSITDDQRRDMTIEAHLTLAALAAKRREIMAVQHHLRAAGKAGFTDFDHLLERPEFAEIAKDPLKSGAVRRMIDDVKSGKEPPPMRPGPRKRPEDRDR